MSNSSSKTPRFVKIVSPLALAIALAACGGGGSSSFGGGSGGTGGTDTTDNERPVQSEEVSSIALLADSLELLADGSQTVNITAIAKNEFNNSISDAEVSFTVDKSATLVVSGNTATLTPNGSGLGTLTVTATSGDITETIQIEVIETVSQAESDIKLGSFDDDNNFVVGSLKISDSNLEAGGKTSIKVSLVDSTNSNEPFTEIVQVTFISRCIAEGLASVTDVSLNAGVATVDYEAKGCSGDDEISVSAIVDGKAIKASSTINVEPAVVASLTFDTAEPANIGLKGMGLNEVSTVTFTVRDKAGHPVVNQDVDFTLSTQTGGITLVSNSAKTNAEGEVSAKVRSGTKATTVKVKAKIIIGSDEFSTESRGLVISTGIADQNSFSLSVDKFNPEALGYDGEEVTFFVNAADHFNNPVPDNTAVSFTTEAGSVDPFCVTTNGSCSVKWRSTGERPADGRVTVLASMQGEESFVDSNGNGLLDDGESFDDLAETYRDDNFDGTFDAAGTGGTDELQDYNENGKWEDKDGEYSGLLCNPTNTVVKCSEDKNVYVSDSLEIVMSGSKAVIDRPSTVTISSRASAAFDVSFADLNGQPLPAGSTVDVSIASSAADADSAPHTIVSEASWAIANTNANQPSTYSIIVQDGGTGLSSILQIRVTTPKGITTVVYVNLVEEGTQQEPELATSMDLSASQTQILRDGSQPVTVTAIIKDVSNNVLSGIPVFFSVGDKGTLNVSSNTAILTPSSDAVAGDQLVITATVTKSTGDIVKTIVIDVVEAADVKQATDLEFTASSRQLFSAGTDPIVLSATAKDENNNTIPDATVIFSVDNGATITPNEGAGVVKTANLTPGSKANRTLTVTATSGSVVKQLLVEVVGTNLTAEGPASIAINKPTEYLLKLQDSADNAIAFAIVDLDADLGSVTPPTGQTNANGELLVSLNSATGGIATLTASSEGASATKQIDISGNDFTLTSASTNDIALGVAETITVEWLVDGNPKIGEVISIRSTRGTVSTSDVLTGINGQDTFTVISDTAGTTTITAETTTGLTTVLKKEFVATDATYLSTQASPSLISPNKSSTIITKVRDDNDNPVKDVSVSFNLTDTVNGELSSSKAVTDSLGRAEVIYTAGDSSSALEGVKINTSFIKTDTTIVSDQVALTVGGDALRIVLGSDEILGDSGIFYTKDFGVIVTDSAGNPVLDQKVDFTIAATHYVKGVMVPGLTTWSQRENTKCSAEDFDHDGNLDVGEDENDNGTLEPSQVATVTGTGSTDDQGKLLVTVVYPQSEALWTIQRLTATTVVSGTEYVEHTSFPLAISAGDSGDPTVMVPNATYFNEDRNGNGAIDTFSEDINNNGQLDIGEDANNNGQLDLVVSEDINNNGVLDDGISGSDIFVGPYGSSSDCSNPN